VAESTSYLHVLAADMEISRQPAGLVVGPQAGTHRPWSRL